MERHTLTLPSGQTLSSGGPGPAILSCRYSAAVNEGPCLSPGAATASEVTLELYDPQGLSIAVGDAIEVAPLGHFTVGSVRKEGRRLRLTAQDCLTALDKDMTDWLPVLQEQTYTLSQLITAVCDYCGLTWAEEAIPNGDLPIPPIRSSAVTGRQILSWAAQAAGRFLAAEGPDTVALRWYQDRGHSLAPTGEQFFYSRRMEAPVAAPTAVTVRRSESDIGVTAGEGETLFLTGNPLLAEATRENAQAILDQMALPCVPCAIETPVDVRPGEIFTVDGTRTLAMAVTRELGRSTVTCAAEAPQRSRFQSQVQALAGRAMELELEVEGVKAQVSHVQGQAQQNAAWKMEVAGIESRVEAVESAAQGLTTQSTALSQRSDALELTVLSQAQQLSQKADAGALTQLSEHFRFDEAGMTIWSSGTGMGIGVSQERVVFTGGENPSTVILPDALETEHLKAQKLTLGPFALLPRTNGNLSLRYTG